MSVKFKKTKVYASIMLAFGGSLAVGVTPSMAQQPPAQQLDRVEVTGSLIKRIDAETAAPLQIITREDIQNTGRTTLQEVLRSVPRQHGLDRPHLQTALLGFCRV